MPAKAVLPSRHSLFQVCHDRRLHWSLLNFDEQDLHLLYVFLVSEGLYKALLNIEMLQLLFQMRNLDLDLEPGVLGALMGRTF